MTDLQREVGLVTAEFSGQGAYNAERVAMTWRSTGYQDIIFVLNAHNGIEDLRYILSDTI